MTHLDPANSLEHRLADLFRDVVGLETSFTPAELLEESGLSLELGLAIWRAFGFPEPDLDTCLFDETDRDSLKAVKTLLDLGIAEEDVLTLARVFGQVFARLAEAEQRVYNQRFIEPLVKAGLDAEEIGVQLRPVSEAVLPLVDQLLANAHRRMIDVAIRQLVISGAGSATEDHAVAIADLVDYSSLSAESDPQRLSELLGAFGDAVMDACSQNGTRLVKMIGDAALFVSPHVDHVVETARAILKRIQSLPLEARIGIDHGKVLPLEGDYFGQPVNVAARIVAVAEPSTITTSASLVKGLGPEELVVPLGSKTLKGVGEVELFVLEAQDSSDH